MAETRHTATLQVRADARAVTGVGKEVKKAFDPANIKDFAREAHGLNRVLKTTGALLDRIGERVARIGADGGTAFAKMAAELTEATKQAHEAERALKALETARKAVGRGGPAGSDGGYGGGGGGGSGGNAGDAGGGGGDGRGWGARGGRWASSYAKNKAATAYDIATGMPGMGAIMTGLTAIPVGGAIAGGSLMAASGSYSSHLRYQQAFKSAAPFIGSPSDALGLRDTASSIGANARSQTKAKEAGNVQQAIAELWANAPTPVTANNSRATAEKLLFDVFTGKMDPGVAAMGYAMGSNGQQSAGGDLGGLNLASGVNRARGQQAAINSLAASGTAVATAGDGAGGRAVSRWAGGAAGIRQVGARYGSAGPEALQEAAAMAQASQGRANADDYEFAKANQSLFGTGVDQTGTLLGELSYTGNQGGRTDAAAIIGSAVARGLESSEINTYLERTAGFLSSMAQNGMKVDAAALIRGEERLANTGIAGWRAGAIAQSFGAGASEAGFNGPGGAADWHMMRANGYTGKGGAAEYAKARMSMQDAGGQADKIGEYLSGIVPKNAPPEVQALIVQKAMSAMGTRVGPEEAAKLAAGVSGQGFGGPGGKDYLQKILASGATSTAGYGSVVAEAGIENERAVTGGRIAGAMQNLERTTNNMAATFENVLGGALNGAADALAGFTAALKGASGGGRKAAH